MKQTKHIYLSSNKLLRPLSYRVLKGQNNLSYCKFCFKIKFYTMVMNIEQKIVLQILFDSTSTIFQIEKFDYVNCILFSSWLLILLYKTYIYVMCITKICYIWFWNLCKFINTISLQFKIKNMVSIVHTNWTFVIYLFLHSFFYFTTYFALFVKATLDFKFDTKISFLHHINQKHLLILNMFRSHFFFMPC